MPFTRTTAIILSMILQREFYMGDGIDTARAILGKLLCRRMDDGTVIRAKIAEVELYHECERGCHAYMGRKTPRNAAMFLAGGHAYVYFTYGMHYMLNIIIGPAGCGVGVLIRAVELDGGNGPARLTKRMNITRELNGVDICAPNAPLWLEDAPPLPARKIKRGPRIGIDSAGADAKRPWRFAICDSKYLSRPI